MSWSGHTEELVKSWGEKAAGLKWMHLAAERMWTRIATQMSLIGIGVSAVGSALAFLSTNSMYSKQIMYSAGAIGLLSSFIQSIKKFYNAEEEAAKHNIIAKRFGSLYRSAPLQLSYNRDTRQDVREFTNWAAQEYNQLQLDAPTIPHGVITKFKGTFTDSHNVPDVAQDRFDIIVCSDKE